MKKSFEYIRRITLSKRLNLFACAILVPFSVLIIYLINALSVYGMNYNRIVKSVTTANQFNTTMKEDIDYCLYYMVRDGLNVDEIMLANKERYRYDRLSNPYIQIADARQAFTELASITTASDNAQRIKMIMTNLDTLERRIREVDESCTEPKSYDMNMKRLDDNIYMLTEILQENIQNYIYNEVVAMEHVRAQLEMQQRQAVHVSVLLFAGVFAVASVASRVMARSVSKPIEELCRTTELVAKGDFDTRAEGTAGDEISVLTKSFNSMVGQIGVLVENIKEEQHNLRDTELKLLQAQINPHFLYNTLDTIIWLAEDKQTEQVVSMVGSLSEFFRTTLSEGRDVITIKEEEAHIRSYLEIQQFRYRDILEYEIAIPETVYHNTIMKLTIQPLVENALYHGIKNKRGKGMIRVTARKTEDVITIDVIDNGIGMKAEELDSICSKLTGQQHKEGGFGLANVHERIQLNYGERFGLSFTSEYGAGTTATVTIPAVVEKK